MRTRRGRREDAGRWAIADGATGKASSSGGFSMVEVLVAAVVLVVAVVGMAGSMLSSMALNRVNRDTAVAQQAARRALEELRGVPFDEVFAVYNAVPGDNLGGAVPERGPAFLVPGLDVLPDDADGAVGRIEFPVEGEGAAQELRENVTDAGLGMPRDLNGDGVPDGLNHATDYTLLPVRVVVEWRGVTGPRQIRLETMLCAR